MYIDNPAEEETGFTVLHTAVTEDDLEAVEILLELGADANKGWKMIMKTGFD